MKKVLFFLIFIGISNLALAQYQGQIRVQYANEVALKVGFLGQNFSGEYFPIDNISVAPAYTIFLAATGKSSGVDINARYYFTEDKLQLYGLTGYGYYLRRYEFNPLGRISYNSLNIGAGGIYKLSDELGINPEIRFQTQRNEFLFKLGVVYFIN